LLLAAAVVAVLPTLVLAAVVLAVCTAELSILTQTQR